MVAYRLKLPSLWAISGFVANSSQVWLVVHSSEGSFVHFGFGQPAEPYWSVWSKLPLGPWWHLGMSCCQMPCLVLWSWCNWGLCWSRRHKILFYFLTNPKHWNKWMNWWMFIKEFYYHKKMTVFILLFETILQLYHFLLPCQPSKPFHILLLPLFQTHCLFFHFIACIYMYMYISKYNLLRVHNATCKCIFRTGHLMLASQLEYSPLKKTISLSLSIPY